MLFVFLLFVLGWWLRAAATEIYWIPNKEGIFSQFLQLRTMMHIASEFQNATLVVPSFHTNHTYDSHLNLCTLFTLPASVSCPRDVRVNVTKCRHDSSIIRRANTKEKYHLRKLYYEKLYNSESICYKASLPYLGGETRRDAILRAVSLNTPVLHLGNETIHTLMTAYKNILLDQSNQTNYTVVHWRRGDQLISRCLQGKDNSVNCMDVSQLITAVKRVTMDQVVYIATNEVSWKDVDVRLLSAAGFRIFNESLVSYKQNSAVALLVDASLMLDASTFIGWGISIMNDVIEHERMLRNKSWCEVNQEVVVYPTWCWLQQQYIASYKENSTEEFLPFREILLAADDSMKRSQLILSNYNVSSMPAYLIELKKERIRASKDLHWTNSASIGVEAPNSTYPSE